MGTPLDLVRLTPLMARTAGSAAVPIGLIDGPVAASHPDLVAARLGVVAAGPVTCEQVHSRACQHGTFVAGMLAARRGGVAPAIAPECPLLVSPIFSERPDAGLAPRAAPDALARAVIECVAAGVRVLNVSAALVGSTAQRHRALEDALGRAARQGVLVIAAAGNEHAIDGTTLTRYPWVIPVVSCDDAGRPAESSNMGASTARTGLRAPGVRVTSLAPVAGALTLTGTSAAVPFVTGAAALLWSEFPSAPAAAIHLALTRAVREPRRSIVPPLLDAWAAYLVLRDM
jgi:subtilisin family serine protease